jgi:hypothetical protein
LASRTVPADEEKDVVEQEEEAAPLSDHHSARRAFGGNLDYLNPLAGHTFQELRYAEERKCYT